MWIKSSYSRRTNCVEMMWKKSTYSGYEGTCVETSTDNVDVYIRDSKNPDGHILTATPEGWNSFINFVTS